MHQDHIAKVLEIIKTNPIVLNNEKDVQARISELLDAAGILHTREVKLAAGDIVDFMVEGGIAIEVKLKAAKRAIYKQCERYCQHDKVNSLILVSATAMGFPEEINGRPCYTASLGAGWL